MRLELTRRGDYAVRTMLALADVPDGSLVSVRTIAERMVIPHRFLPQVMQDLVRAGLVDARTGRSGGYRLARPAAEIGLLEVIEAIEGDGRRRACVLRGIPCGVDGLCRAHDVFYRAQEALLTELGSASLADLSAAPDRTSAP